MTSFDFVCSKCDKKPEVCTASLIRSWSLRRLDIPYFVCINCLTCGYSKRLVRQKISRWRNDYLFSDAKEYAYDFIYRKIVEHLEEIIGYRVKKLGQSRGRFYKK